MRASCPPLERHQAPGSPAGGHANLVTGLAFPAGGKEFYTGDATGAVLRWDAATGKELGTLELEGSASRGTVVLAPDGTRALCVESGGLGVYDVLRADRVVLTAAALDAIEAAMSDATAEGGEAA